jgi:uncharacterized protein YegL
MKKKLILALAASGTAIAMLPLLAAFEAHIINVTARIENALGVSPTEIPFGTVFPQEKLFKSFDIFLSESFLAEDRVDDVDYVIKQKPKPRPRDGNGPPNGGGGGGGGGGSNNTPVSVPPNETTAKLKNARPTSDPMPLGQSFFDVFVELVPMELTGFQGPVWQFCETHAPAKPDPLDRARMLPDYGNLESVYYDHCFPLLCPYLSKEKARDEAQEPKDTSLPAFHNPFASTTKGHLAKSLRDIEDSWVIDLDVPCFFGECAQDWKHLGWELPKSLEKEVFGCDLWVEVLGISLPGFICEEEIDLMLVLDRSLSIDATELATLKTAAHAFVDALAPNGGPHIGQVSFAPTASLDLHLTGVKADIDAAIDALSTALGFATNLEAGILTASGELADGDPHERPAVPDFMVIITDGAPNTSSGVDPFADAEAAADAAKAAGTTIFAVGVGTSSSTAAFLRDDIASSAAHYFDAADFADLEAILEGLVSCPNGG